MLAYGVEVDLGHGLAELGFGDGAEVGVDGGGEDDDDDEAEEPAGADGHENSKWLVFVLA